MKNLSSRGLLSVEDLNALFEERLRIHTHCGCFKVVERHYSSSRGSQVYDRNLPMSIVISLQPEGRTLPMDPVPAKASSTAWYRTGKGSQAN
jgi:hypothetical protein